MINAATLTKNYTLSFPKETRYEMKKHGYKAGQEFGIYFYNDLMYVVPIVDDIRKLRGTLIGVDSFIERDEEDRV